MHVGDVYVIAGIRLLSADGDFEKEKLDRVDAFATISWETFLGEKAGRRISQIDALEGWSQSPLSLAEWVTPFGNVSVIAEISD